MARRQTQRAGEIYSAADTFVTAALRSDGSLFSPGLAVWQQETIDDLYRRFVLQPDERKGVDFETKFKDQLRGAPASTLRLAAEILYVMFLLDNHTGGKAKRALLSSVLSWNAESATTQIPHVLDTVLDTGLVNPGIGFHTGRNAEVQLMVEAARTWKQLSTADRERYLAEPFAFKAFLSGFVVPRSGPLREGLLHLVFPDVFEAAVSQDHKHAIAARWRDLVDPGTADVDEQLLQIRRKLEPTYGVNFDFYRAEIEPLWRESRDEDVEAVQLATVSEDEGPLEGAPLLREEVDALKRNATNSWKTVSADDRKLLARLRAKVGLISRRMADELELDIAVQPFVSHLLPNGRAPRDYWGCVYPRDAADKSYAFQLFVLVGTDHVEFGFCAGGVVSQSADKALVRRLEAEFVAAQTRLKALPPETIAELDSIVRSAGFRYRQRWRGQGQEIDEIEAWVQHATSPSGTGAAISAYLPLGDAIGRGRDLADELVSRIQTLTPFLEAIYRIYPEPMTQVRSMRETVKSLEWLEAETLWTRQELEELCEAIRDSSPQLILAGPPGTSKTWIAKRVSEFLTQDVGQHLRVVQFHPSYGYEDFIEGLRPALGSSGAITFQPVDGVVLDVVHKVSGPGPHIILIDEMNRANLPKVLGELMYLFECREEKVDLRFTPGFELPRSLRFVGTMNTADRSIRSIDVALRRRFDIVECPPRMDVLERYYAHNTNNVQNLVSGLQRLNEELEARLDRHHTVGHAYFMAPLMTRDRLQRIWSRKISPLIEEYFFDQPDAAAEFPLDKFWPDA